MLLYSPEQKRLTRTGNITAAALGLLLTATACSNGGEGVNDEGAAATASATRSKETAETSIPADTTNPRAAKIGKATLDKLVWPGTVELTDACPPWSKNHHGPVEITKSKDGKPQILAMVDARLSWPRDCNPETDSGAGAQRGASAQSGAATLPNVPELYNSGKFINDGVVVEVVGYTKDGQGTCQSDGTNPTATWIEVRAAPGDSTAWVPTALTGYEPSVSDMKEAGIPMDPAQAVYAGTHQDGCLRE
jgi:hypothetical protein